MIRQIAVIGTGTMGRGIAYLAAVAGYETVIHDADPAIQEEWKWRGTPVWSHDGGVCTGESYKQVVKLTFFRGAALEDPHKLFNSSLEGNTRRAIDLRSRCCSLGLRLVHRIKQAPRVRPRHRRYTSALYLALPVRP